MYDFFIQPLVGCTSCYHGPWWHIPAGFLIAGVLFAPPLVLLYIADTRGWMDRKH